MQIHIDSSVEKFIYSLETQTVAKVLRTIDLLEKFGSYLSTPHSKKIIDSLFELRARGQQEVRIFYCFHKNQIYLLSGYIKKSEKAPQKEIEKALNKYRILTA